MEPEIVTLKLPKPMLAALRRIAAGDDVTVGQVIRDAISRDIARREKAKTPVRADERLVAPLRALLADDFAYATDWADLITRLRRKGYALAEAGGGLILQDHASGQRLCKGSELGHGYAQLLRKFDAPFPGHTHQWLLDRVRARA
ncbi:relaxase family protein [Rhodobacter ferrooxidans]|uniref:Uncharacterized protein n=1 Tax=Rhodobacter ferrooxidans TaxID=371731 RepID=C8RW44_9RHOB|nr:ribbon-helix-helix protein, CopG family [Rhodobacter sp. SW2]EEW26787.1 conserved hypothetical protein [Rhodobacter sp. SW2]